MADEIFSSLGLSFKPSDGIGRQFSQSLAFFDETAFSLAISEEVFSIISNAFAISNGKSFAICKWEKFLPFAKV